MSLKCFPLPKCPGLLPIYRVEPVLSHSVLDSPGRLARVQHPSFFLPADDVPVGDLQSEPLKLIHPPLSAIPGLAIPACRKLGRKGTGLPIFCYQRHSELDIEKRS